MKAFLIALLFPSLLLADIYVSPTGSDDAAGTEQRPLATLGKAVELSRKGTSRRIVVSGDFYDVSVALTSADSGITIEGKSQARLFGGLRLQDWTKLDDHLFAAPVPSGRKLDPRMLQVNGEPRPRSRLPEAGTFTHQSNFNVPWMSTTGGGWKRKPTHEELTTLVYNPADIPDMLDPVGAEITVYHMWDESTVSVSSIDRTTHTLTLSPETGHPPGAFNVHKYVLWNLRAGLTRPGQWFFDRAASKILYYPLPGEDPSRLSILVPTTNSPLTLQGTRENPIHNVVVTNIDLACANVPLMAAGFAARGFPAAVSIQHARNCSLTGLRISGVAGHAIASLTSDTHHLRIERCDIAHCGAGGIYIGGANCTLANNRINHIGEQYPSAIGIMAGGTDQTIIHNTVHDTSYSAINAGGTRINVEANDISRCMQVLHDGAAIYMFAGKFSTMRGNFAHEITDTGGYGASAYYLDERSEDCTVERNLSVNVGWPCHNHMAKHNTIRNNVFINAGDMKLTFPRSTDYTFEGNVLYATGKIRFDNFDAITTLSNNVVYSGAGKVEGIRLKDYSAAGPSTRPFGDTRFADPLFVDWKSGDYGYKRRVAGGGAGAGSRGYERCWGGRPLRMRQGGEAEPGTRRVQSASARSREH
jgi:hypothetical protein